MKIQIWMAVALGVATGFAQAASVVGNWQGTLDANGVKLRLGLHISEKAPGEYTSTLDSIDQGAMGIPVAKTSFSASTLHFEIPALRIEYTGKLSADGNEIAGTFTQGAQLPLTFERVGKVETLNRPQNPKPPFPYQSIDITYPGDGATLGATLTIPHGAGPFPAAILITGSGPQDRDETILGHKPFLVIADYLTRRGIAVLRADDRGVGKSTGSSTQATIDEMASDVLSGVAVPEIQKRDRRNAHRRDRA
ncbi:MAG: alpha/beta hydrolase family protein [Bryobacteraceae bacterium]